MLLATVQCFTFTQTPRVDSLSTEYIISYVKSTGKQIPPIDISISVGILTDYYWEYHRTIDEIDWDCLDKTTQELLLASAEVHARSVVIGQRQNGTARLQPNVMVTTRARNIKLKLKGAKTGYTTKCNWIHIFI